MTISRLSLLYVAADLLLIIVSVFAGKFWLINTQLAFICSMLITFASFLSYKIMIEKKIENEDFEENGDQYDHLEDPYKVFEDDKESKEISKESNKKTSKFNNITKGLVSGISGALSIYRLLSYIVLFIIILVMIRHGLFDAVPFFIGLSVVPLVSLISGFFAGN